MRGAAADGRTYGKCVGSAAGSERSTCGPRARARQPRGGQRGHGSVGASEQAGRIHRPGQPRQLRLPQLRHGVPGRQSLRRQLQRLQHLRHLEPGGADADDLGRLPRRPGRPVGVQAPAVHVGRGDARQEGLHADPGGRCHDALPRCAHLRHQQRRGARAGRPGSDLPRLAYAHARHRQAQQEVRLHLRSGHSGRPAAGGARRLRRQRPTRRPATPVEVADRDHQGPAWLARGRGDRQRAAAVRRPGDGRA